MAERLVVAALPVCAICQVILPRYSAPFSGQRWGPGPPKPDPRGRCEGEGPPSPRAGSAIRRARIAFAEARALPLVTVLERENDEGGRFTIRPFGDSHRTFRSSACAVASCGLAARPPVAGRAASAVAGATPLAEGSVRHSGECVFTPSPPCLGVAPASSIRPGRVSIAATRQRRTSWPVGMADIVDHDWDRPGRLVVWPSRKGLLSGSDPAAAGGMGLSGSIPPGANRSWPRWGVAPIHVQRARIGIRDSLAVPQPQAGQRLGLPGSLPGRTPI